MNFSAMDLNLLLAFDALLTERNVTRAAATVGLSQPAMSNALARLRHLFEDPLLVRKQRLMVPTARARQMARPIHEALLQIRQAVEESPLFKPGTADKSFTVLSTDYIECVLLPPLLRRLKTLAPGLNLRFRRVTGIFEYPEAELASDAADFAIRAFSDFQSFESETYTQDLFQDRHVCIVRVDHPVIRKRLSMKQFVECAHVGVLFRAELGMVDQMLASHGLKRRVAVSVRHFLSAPYIVASTDLIATIPSRLAHSFASHLPIRIFNTPMQTPPLQWRILWHQRGHADLAHTWLRKLICEVASEL